MTDAKGRPKIQQWVSENLGKSLGILAGIVVFIYFWATINFGFALLLTAFVATVWYFFFRPSKDKKGGKSITQVSYSSTEGALGLIGTVVGIALALLLLGAMLYTYEKVDIRANDPIESQIVESLRSLKGIAGFAPVTGEQRKVLQERYDELYTYYKKESPVRGELLAPGNYSDFIHLEALLIYDRVIPIDSILTEMEKLGIDDYRAELVESKYGYGFDVLKHATDSILLDTEVK